MKHSAFQGLPWLAQVYRYLSFLSFIEVDQQYKILTVFPHFKYFKA
jgi:hypothetical protein